MTGQNSKTTSTLFKALLIIIGIYIAGSLLGVAGGLVSKRPGRIVLLIFSVLSCALYLSMLAGTLQKKAWAYWLGFFVFLFQIPIIATPGFTYSVFLGAKFFLTVHYKTHEGSTFLVGLNVLALLAFAFVFFGRKEFPAGGGRGF